ncbi:DinB family protein [Luteipulveratus halotolerans]|uniref:Mini-circle protein n=1 Tax=Luteipulveratus halotolerans TaxID=1631356 RepID=A0A0L6CK58_9MICO|nr:DinB family protein [Luteipulveratus halotolerans]KNX38181.1 hypothetical protein VV01_15175 [Luteipulveratus halotolerans]
MTDTDFTGLWPDGETGPREMRATHGERDALVDYLKNYRLTLKIKCTGLDAEQLARRAVPPSTMSLLGLVRHMARVEHNWFVRVLQQQKVDRIYWSEQDDDLDFNGAVADPAVVADARESWEREVAAAEAYVEGQTDLGLTVPLGDDDTIELREVLVHMIEEYARHCGHADLMREVIDGRTGQ